MKKIVNFNFITILVVAVFLSTVAISVGIDVTAFDRELEAANNEIDELNERPDDDVVKGYALLGYTFGYGFGILASGIVWMLLVWAPAILAALILVPAIIARAFCAENNSKVLAYRIWMFFSYLWTVVFEIIIGLVIYSIAKINSVSIILGIMFLYTVIILILGIGNTYSNRIKCENGDLYAN